jgi:hypothetical protein
MDWSPTEDIATVPHHRATTTPTAPTGHPAISNDIPPDEVVVIVTIHHLEAGHVNRNSPYVKTHLDADDPGVNIFLHQINGQICFSMGREVNNDTGKAAWRVPHDISLPGSNVAIRQFVLFPDWDRGYWRLHSFSEKTSYVNGAPIQKYTGRTKGRNNYPSAIFLEQSAVNRITAEGMQIDVWLMKSVSEAYRPKDFTLPPLQAGLQNVAHRPEDWARDRYMQIGEQISTKTIRIIDRFTGESHTAKLFRTGDDRQQTRDREFLMFSKQDVDASIVRYLQCTEVNRIPSIITNTHEGFATYGALRDDIRKSHPGVRFSIASKLLRRLFSSLAFLHFNGIIHGHVSNDNVLLRFVNQDVEHILLVDYSTVHTSVPGMPVPVENMIAEGRSAMQLIENCCDIWAFRSGPTPRAMGEELMQKRTMDTMRKYQTVQRVAVDYFERQGNSHKSVKGQKLNRLLNKLGNAWSTAKAKQAENLADREVALLSKSKVDAKIEEWESAHSPQASFYKQYMILSLGNSYVDSLADQLYVKRWAATPQEVCAKIKALGGSLEEPWQTFEVHRTTSIECKDESYNEEEVMSWLASCYEIHPEWRSVLETACRTHLQQGAGLNTPADLRDLCQALQVHGQLPPPMMLMFERFMNTDTFQSLVDETYRIWYHVPSLQFNLTQLQRLAAPDRFAATVSEGEPCCDNFIEVRGDAKIQGCYAPLTLLKTFADRFGLKVPDTFNYTPSMPIHDPADFSQVPQGRIVLARLGFIGYGSVLRTGDQCNFLYSRTEPEFIDPSQFIPTYFGDMKVLPQLPPNVLSYNRPGHWSKFKTTEEFEEAADLSKRDMLKAKKLKAGKLQPGGNASSAVADIMKINDDLALGQVLRERERVRSEARPPPKRATDAMSSKPAQPSPKRSKTERTAASPPKVILPEISRSFIERMEARMQARPGADQSRSAQTYRSLSNDSFTKRNSALFTCPPLDPTNINQSFTVADDTEGLDDDWKEVEDMLNRMPDDEDDDEDMVAGITGFQYHGDMSDESDEQPPVKPVDKVKAKIPKSAKSKPLAKPATKPFRASQSQGRDPSPSQSSGKPQPFQATTQFESFGETAKSFERQNGGYQLAMSKSIVKPKKKLKSLKKSTPPTELTPLLGDLAMALGPGPSGPVIPISARQKPLLNPNNSLGARFQPTQRSRLSFGGSTTVPNTPQLTMGDSFDSKMPPTQYNSPNLRPIDDPVQGLAQPTRISFGGSPTQLNTQSQPNPFSGPPDQPKNSPQAASVDSDDMPPTRYCSPSRGFATIPTAIPHRSLDGSPTQPHTAPQAFPSNSSLTDVSFNSNSKDPRVFPAYHGGTSTQSNTPRHKTSFNWYSVQYPPTEPSRSPPHPITPPGNRSFDPDMPPTQYMSPNLRPTGNPSPNSTYPPTQPACPPAQSIFPSTQQGGSPNQSTTPPHKASDDSDMPPTQYMSPGGGFGSDAVQGNTYPPTEPSDSPPKPSPPPHNPPPKKCKTQVRSYTEYQLDPSIYPAPNPWHDTSSPPQAQNTSIDYPLDDSIYQAPNPWRDTSSPLKTPPQAQDTSAEEEYPPTQYNSPNLTVVRNTPPRATAQRENPGNTMLVADSFATILVADSFNGGGSEDPQPESPTNPSRDVTTMDSSNSGMPHGVYSNPANAIAGFFREQQDREGDEDMPDTDGEDEGSGTGEVVRKVVGEGNSTGEVLDEEVWERVSG